MDKPKNYSKEFLKMISEKFFELQGALNDAVLTDYEPATADEKSVWKKWQDLTLRWSNGVDAFDERHQIRESVYNNSHESYERLKKLLTEED